MKYTEDEMTIIKNSILLGNYLDTDPLKMLAEIVDQLLEENRNLKEAQRWIPVSERLPEEVTLVNVTYHGKVKTRQYKILNGIYH